MFKGSPPQRQREGDIAQVEIGVALQMIGEVVGCLME